MYLLFISAPSVVPPLFNVSNVSVNQFWPGCKFSAGFKVVYAAYAFINLLLLPLYVFILCLGFQRWCRQPSAAAGAAMSHSDFFTYQMMIIGIFDVFGSALVVLGGYLESQITFLIGVYLLSFVIPNQTISHVLTCMERYAAVVHAIAYMNLREAVKVRVRRISTAAVWLISSGLSTLILMYLNFAANILLPCLAICLIIASFCCLSVLHFLRRPKPGGASGNQQNPDQSKKRAFNMILAITVTLALRMLGILLCAVVKNFILVDAEYLCALMDSGVWLLVPSNLVLPLLFLHRAGKL